jgi:NitT/TauT family transport system substrate-binding protein
MRFAKGFILVSLLAVVMVFTACRGSDYINISKENPTINIRIAALLGPTGMGMVGLMEQNEQNKTINDYEFSLVGSPDELIGKIVNGEVEIAAVPANLAAVLYQKTDGTIQLAAVNTLGVLFVLQKGNDIKSITDLRGKKVNVSGKGATPDYTFRYILQNNGIEPDKDIFLNYSLQHADLATAMAAGEFEYALLPQPHVTSALLRNKDLKIAIDLTEEWSLVTDGGELIMGVIIVQREFAEKNKEALDQFLLEYRASVDFVNIEQVAAAQLMVKFGILPNEQIASTAIPYSNIVYVDADEARKSLEENYQVLYEFEPKSVGGKLPNEDFWYSR